MGFTVGAPVGASDGAEVGFTVGAKLGRPVGEKVKQKVGASVPSVGADEGCGVGIVGNLVGARVGGRLGMLVGQSVGIVGDRSRSKQIAKFEAASDYLFFQGPAPKTAIQEDLPDFFSAVRTALNCAAVLRIEPTPTLARRPTRHRKTSSLRSRT